jgi:hypothetical protein
MTARIADNSRFANAKSSDDAAVRGSIFALQRDSDA